MSERMIYVSLTRGSGASIPNALGSYERMRWMVGSSILS